VQGKGLRDTGVFCWRQCGRTGKYAAKYPKYYKLHNIENNPGQNLQIKAKEPCFPYGVLLLRIILQQGCFLLKTALRNAAWSL
jgi:hypothetical protein